MFRDREDAAHQLAQKLKGRALHDPLVLAIPRGGVVTGAVLAQELDAELDVVLSRKLRAPWQPELAIGAVSEDGRVYVNCNAQEMICPSEAYLAEERRYQLAEIARCGKLFRSARPAATIADRSVIVTDDGIATGSTMIAAVQTARSHGPYELIVAVPVAPPKQLQEIRRWCDDVVCLHCPDTFWAIGQFYVDFNQVDDAQVVEILNAAAAESAMRTGT